MMSFNVFAEVFYAGIVAAAGVREYFNSKSKLSLVFGLYFYMLLILGAYRQSVNPSRCSIFRTTSGFVALISSVITVIIRMSIIVDTKFYKRHLSKFKTYGMLSLLRYNMGIKECRGALFQVFISISYGLFDIFKLIHLILITRVNYINGVLNMIVVIIAVHLAVTDNGIEFFYHRFIL